MPAHEALRDRRRAQTVSEIKQAALGLLDSDGPEGLALRGIARQVGVSAQALYHYFPSREALVTALVSDAYHALAAAVADAVPPPPSGGSTARAERIVAAGLAYRQWALAHRSEFLLALGTPLTGYAAPPDGPTTRAAHALGAAFRDVVFGGWTPEELARVSLPRGLPGLRSQLAAADQFRLGLPPGALALFTAGWSTLHGLVVLELLGHLPWVGDAGADMCRAALLEYAGQLREHDPDPAATSSTSS